MKIFSFGIALFAFTAPLCAAPRPNPQPKILKSAAPREYSRLVLQANRKNKYEAELVVPVLRARNAAAQKTNREVRAWAQNDLKEFVALARKEKAGSDATLPPYSLLVAPSRVFATAHLSSVSLDRNIYTGGAHGMTNSFVWRFGTVNGKTRALHLGDFFRGGNYQKEINDLIMNRLRQNPRADWVHSLPDETPMVKNITVAQLDSFSVERDGLRWTFDPYEMGSYASGTIDVKLDFEALGPNFRAQWLK